ncbi:MAG: polynucleotide adenylyltransferase PcnB [Abyssibacter sp.]|nr:polynucleotide adenylyltransferase PcnB [Abyssibacter sp.]
MSRDAHNVSRQDISQGALDVLYDLGRAGYEAYLVGGGVRDLLAGIQPKDFDVATDAKPEEVRDVFRRARLIGRRFRLAHVRAGGEIIEVATFRAQPRSPEEGEEQAEEALDDHDHMLDEGGRILRDNVYGSLEDDAFRRDFTVNALYYRVTDFSVVDYVGGMDDMVARQIRLIGDPETRYREDPVRMLRAVRIANKLGFDIEVATAAPIRELADLLTDVPGARLFDEVLKLFLSAQAEKNFDDLIELGLFQVLFPQTAACLHQDGVETLIRGALQGTAARVREDKPVTPAFLFAALLWPALRDAMASAIENGQNLAQTIPEHSGDVAAEQVETVALPRRFSTPMREIWALQPRFHRRNGRRPERLAAHPRFRAAYDFLILRAAAGEETDELVQWWTEYQQGNAPVPPAGGPNPKRRRRRRRRTGETPTSD